MNDGAHPDVVHKPGMQQRNPRQPRRQKPSGAMSLTACVALSVLLILPVLALCRLTEWLDGRWVFGAATALSAATFVFYRDDKRRAQLGEWRIPESTLHLLELLGGWPGAFLGQRWFRHKTAKCSFQFVFWCIVVLHQLAAWEIMTGGKWLAVVLGR